MPTLDSHTHCQAAQSNRTIQSLPKSVSIPTLGRKRKKTRKPNNRYKTCPSGHVS